MDLLKHHRFDYIIFSVEKKGADINYLLPETIML